MKKLFFTILKFVIFFITWLVGFVLICDPIIIKNSAFQRLVLEFVPFALLVVINFLFLFFIEKKQMKIPIFNSFLKNTLVGFVTGVLWLGSSVIILTVSGTMNIQSKIQ